MQHGRDTRALAFRYLRVQHCQPRPNLRPMWSMYYCIICTDMVIGETWDQSAMEVYVEC